MSASTTSVWPHLEEIVGAGHLATHPAELSGYEVDGLRPAAVVKPGSVAEVAEVVRFAASEKLAVVPVGGRTKLPIGAPPRRYDVALDLTRLNRILAYDPGDLTLGVEAGIRFTELDAILAGKGQFVPLAPAFADRATIGGILATNSSTPLRHAYGPARDYVLGMEFVTGEGIQAKSGGRVVKNVTGYDLHKLMIGALGTLGVITRVNFRTFPLPRTQRTFVASFGRAEEALELCRAIAKSPLQPRLVEVVEPRAAQILMETAGGEPPTQLPAGQWSVVVAAAGDERVVERHGADLSRMAEAMHATGFIALTDDEKKALLGRIREFPRHVVEFSPAATLFRIGVLPMQMAALLERARQVTERNQIASAALVRALGTVFLALVPPALDDSTLARLAQTATELIHSSSGSEIGGRPMIEWCPTRLKQQVNVWGPARDDLVLMQRLKQAFDPRGILSPGRFMGGI
jgi:glycolate oxidase FAD binding subunit